MAATLKADGTIVFRDGKSLLSIEDITRSAFELLKTSQERQVQFEQRSRIAQLRQSCGVKAEPLTIKRPEPYRG
jgi:hypothetical protein